MQIDVVPFHPRFTAEAATLLAATHQPGDDPTVDISDPDTARAHVEAMIGVGPGVAAFRAGELAGFMTAAVPNTPGVDSQARIRMQHHAAAADHRRSIYRTLYRELSDQLAGIGCFEHAIAMAASHRDVFDCFVELGFGIDQIKGLRPSAPPQRPAGKIDVRRAEPGDLGQLLDLVLDLQRFHSEAPMLRPAFIDLRAIRDDLLSAMADERRLVVVTVETGTITGAMVADPDTRFTDAATIGIAVVRSTARAGGIGTALLSGVLEWAAARGYSACGAEWTSANLVSDAFWRGRGFAPARLTLARRIDPRVAWANTALDYRHFLRG